MHRGLEAAVPKTVTSTSTFPTASLPSLLHLCPPSYRLSHPSSPPLSLSRHAPPLESLHIAALASLYCARTYAREVNGRDKEGRRYEASKSRCIAGATAAAAAVQHKRTLAAPASIVSRKLCNFSLSLSLSPSHSLSLCAGSARRSGCCT